MLESFLPAVAEGDSLDLTDLPTSLPGYLVKLTAELRLDGESVASHGGFTLGQELSSVTAISRLTGGWHQAHNKPIAGEFYAFGIDLQGVSGATLEAAQSRLEATKARLEAEDVAGLTKEDLVGDMLFAAATSYFAANDAGLQMFNLRGDSLGYRLPSFGTVSTNLETVYSFGVPRQVEMAGLFVDMDVVTHSLWAKDNDAAKTVAAARFLGYQSSQLEHLIPELLFIDEENSGEAVSAVKALAIASEEGQRIYQIAQDNVDIIENLVIGDEVKREIRDSVAVGKIALVSEKDITVGEWIGVGYIIFDPLTGSGAYRISGGDNGAVFRAGGRFGITAAFILIALESKFFTAKGIAIALSILLTQFAAFALAIKIAGGDDKDFGCLVYGFIVGFDVAIVAYLGTLLLLKKDAVIGALEAFIGIGINLGFGWDGLPSISDCIRKKIGEEL